MIIPDYKSVVEKNSTYSSEKSDDFGEVFTPFFLIDDMLDLVSKEDWSNPNITFFDPCAGKGNFQARIVERLMKGLEDVILDEKERYKHILENQIFMIEYQEDSYNDIKEAFDPEGILDLNLKHGNSLETFSQEFGIERFTYTIANPPYQSAETRRRIFNKFIEHTYTFSDNQIYVIPSSWIYNTHLKNRFEE